MNKGWILVLLISLGLNLGLGIRLLGDRGEPGGRGGFRQNKELWRGEGRRAHQDSVTNHKMFHRRLDHVTGELDLSPEQREAFGKVLQETGRLLMQKRALIAEKRDLLHTLVTDDNIDKDGVRAAIAELGQEQAVLDSLVAETVLQEMEVLEPGQRGRYLELLSFDKGGAGHRHGGGGRGTHQQ
jgi:Spy/CpxP family protein refolding chaperone